MEKAVKIFNENFSFDVTSILDLKYLDFQEESVSPRVFTQEIQGTDGVLLGSITFDPFNLALNFSFRGVDNNDLLLLKQKLRGLFFRREPYYVWHSDAPGKKYAVYCDSSENEDLTSELATFKVNFVVYKGYSESLDDTSEFDLKNGRWQFESVAVADDSIKYTHNKDYFEIYNGSNDTINPLLKHKLQIEIIADAPNGIKIRNLTTEDDFHYKKPLTPGKKLILQGVHPLLDGNRVGIHTNWQWLTLAPGYNIIKIEDDDIKSIETKWKFNYIFR